MREKKEQRQKRDRERPTRLILRCVLKCAHSPTGAMKKRQRKREEGMPRVGVFGVVKVNQGGGDGES